MVTSAQRDACWKARDEWKQCLDMTNMQQQQQSDACKDAMEQMKQACPPSWVRNVKNY